MTMARSSTCARPHWWRSSVIGDIKKHCLAVIHPDFADMADRRVYGSGTVAHDVYNRVQLATTEAGSELDYAEVQKIALGAIKRGAAEGRSFEGVAEPPLRPDQYLEGKELALRWLAERPALPGRETELAITIDRWGGLVDKDSPDRWMRGILDLMYVDEDRILVIPDLKTDWPSETDALFSAQRKIQMMLGFSMYRGEIAGLRPEIWNLRRMKIYPHEDDRDRYTIDFESLEVLDEWRQDLLALTDGYDAALTTCRHCEHLEAEHNPGAGCPQITGGGEGHDCDCPGYEPPTPESLASPGFGCLAGENGCPALAQCKAGQAWVAKRGATELPSAAVQLPVLQAEVGRLREIIEPAARASGPIEVGGMICGFEDRPGHEPRRDAVLELWREFRGSQIEQTVDCLCMSFEGKFHGMPDEDCPMCSGLGDSIDWERELARQRALLVTFLGAVGTSSTEFEKGILVKLWPLKGVSKEERLTNKQTRALVSERLLEPVVRPKWFCRKLPGVETPGETLTETLEASIAMNKERERFKENGDG